MFVDMLSSAKRRTLEHCQSIFNKYWKWSNESGFSISIGNGVTKVVSLDLKIYFKI